MGVAGGLVLFLPSDRYELLEAHAAEEMPFAEPVDEFPHSRTAPLVCFLMRGKSISAVAKGRKGVRAGTELRRLNLTQIALLSQPVSAKEVIAASPARLKAGIENRLRHGGMLTPKGFSAVVDILIQRRPELEELLLLFSKQRRERIARLSARARKSLATQKEAVVTAMAIARQDREPIQRWTPRSTRTPESFLEGLEQATVREDPMVINDFRQIPGHEFVKEYKYNAAVFENEHSRLTVVLANRQPLERQTGTDLIYVNETYNSVVMVQYKTMSASRAGEAALRLPDPQLDKEVRRMRRVLKELKKCPPDSGIDGWRMHFNPFFFKLCPKIIFNPDDSGLIKGMYLPLEYWDRLCSDPSIKGPRGGKAISYGNAGRYLGNSEFINVVTKGWIGTTLSQTAILKKYIKDTLKSGTAVAFAVETTKDRKGHLADPDIFDDEQLFEDSKDLETEEEPPLDWD